MTRWPIVVACAALLPGLAAGQYANRPMSDSVSAPIRDVRYDVTFMRSNGQQRGDRRRDDVRRPRHGAVVLSLPAWTPGAYEISNFSRWVVELRGDRRRRKPLAWDKLDYDTWRIRPGGAKAVRVSFSYVADTLDNAMAWARPDFLLFNGTNLFLYPEGQPLEYAATVAVHTEADWHVATGMSSGRNARTFTATNYHDLVDMPFFVGQLRSRQRARRGAVGAARDVSRGRDDRGQVRQTAWDQLKRVIPPESAVFGETPWESYTVMQIVDSSYRRRERLGASELARRRAGAVLRRQRIPAVALRARDLSFVEREAPAAGGDVAIPILSSAADAVALGVRGHHRLLRRSRRGARRRRRREGFLRARRRRRSTK